MVWRREPEGKGKEGFEGPWANSKNFGEIESPIDVNL
jgi:hypothetical protein